MGLEGHTPIYPNNALTTGPTGSHRTPTDLDIKDAIGYVDRVLTICMFGELWKTTWKQLYHVGILSVSQ